MISANTRNRIQAISIEGSVADRYFAVTSEVPEKHRRGQDQRDAAERPVGARRRGCAWPACFSGNGNGALSSLAAAAGGGVTVELGAWNNRIGRGRKKR